VSAFIAVELRDGGDRVVLRHTRVRCRVRAALAERPAERRVGVDPDHVQFLTAQAF
jgi:hypothetical protein